jgi:hypothetical protein
MTRCRDRSGARDVQVLGRSVNDGTSPRDDREAGVTMVFLNSRSSSGGKDFRMKTPVVDGRERVSAGPISGT